MNLIPIIVSFDLKNAEPDDYDDVYGLLENELGLSGVDLTGAALPSTTLMGHYPEGTAPKLIADTVVELAKSRLNVTVECILATQASPDAYLIG